MSTLSTKQDGKQLSKMHGTAKHSGAITSGLGIVGSSRWALSDLCQHPPGGRPSTFFNIDGGRSQILCQHPSRGPSLMFFNIDGGRSRIL
jgi:hypothetical protein